MLKNKLCKYFVISTFYSGKIWCFKITTSKEISWILTFLLAGASPFWANLQQIMEAQGAVHSSIPLRYSIYKNTLVIYPPSPDPHSGQYIFFHTRICFAMRIRYLIFFSQKEWLLVSILVDCKKKKKNVFKILKIYLNHALFLYFFFLKFLSLNQGWQLKYPPNHPKWVYF